MAKLLIIYHSQTGNTEAMATAMSEGASSAGATVVLKTAFDATSEDLLSCDAVAIGTPNYFSYMAGAMKDFFDRVLHTIRGKVDDKPYVAFCSSGGGGRQALDSLERICNSIGLNKAFEGIVATGKPSAKVFDDCKELGRKLAQL
ncbi:Flavodoxin [subsurface metagenome]